MSSQYSRALSSTCRFYIIKRTLHGRLEIRNSLLVLKKISLVRCAHSGNIFQQSKRNFVSPRGHVLSSIYASEIILVYTQSNTFPRFIQDLAGDTPLHDAISKEKNGIIDLILSSQRLDITVSNGRGFNPLHQACMKGNKQ